MNDLLSVIVPVYQAEKYLNDCIQSIVNQTYKNLEIILIDDGSTDSSAKICDEWSNKDNRIVVIHKKNGGASDSRNKGIELAKGAFVSFVDADDIILEDMYEDMMKEFDTPDVDLVQCSFRYFEDEIKKEDNKKRLKVDAKEAVLQVLCGQLFDESPCNKIYKRNLIEDVKFVVGETNEDILWMPQVMMRANKCKYIGVTYYQYRVNTESTSRSVSYLDSSNVVINHMIEVSKMVLEKYPDKKFDVLAYQSKTAVIMFGNIRWSEERKKKYPEYYNYFKELIDKTYIYLMLSKRIPLKHKIFGTLYYLGIQK